MREEQVSKVAKDKGKSGPHSTTALAKQTRSAMLDHEINSPSTVRGNIEDDMAMWPSKCSRRCLTRTYCCNPTESASMRTLVV